MTITTRAAALAACLGLALIGSAAVADDQPYTEGPVINVAGIRTEYGHFDDYMKFLATKWKKEMEAEKKAGLILNYEVFSTQPRTADDPDIYLVITFKNWAALDGLSAKMDAVAKQVYGSVETSNTEAAGRAKIRRTLGSQTMQQLLLK